MRILFGVQGTGNGHISRCRTLAKALANQGAKVDYVLSGRAADKYFDVDEFNNYSCYEGMTFVTENGKISLLKTAKKLRAIQLIKDIRTQDLSGYDRVISDFEPITAWAAKWQKKPVLGISNQAIFNYIAPKKRDLVAQMVMKHYAPVTTLIGLHWFHFGYPILPPIIDTIESSAEDGRIIIYLPFERLDRVKTLLSSYADYHFVCFHPDIKVSAQWHNVQLQPLSRTGFVDTMRSCSGIITNAGFALVSEALSLGKKILVKPLKGQFEQIYNAECLQQLGLASAMKTLDHKKIANWLSEPSRTPVIYPDVAETLANWIVTGEQQSITELSNQLWDKVIFPDYVINRLNELGINKPIN